MSAFADFEPARSLRLSYVSQPGERLKDIGNGRVLIRRKGQEDRILDRTTGEITPAEIKRGLRDFAIVVGAFLLIFAGYCLYLFA